MSPVRTLLARLDRPKLSFSIPLGSLAVVFVAVLASQMMVGAVATSQMAGDGPTVAESEAPLDQLEGVNTSHGLTLEPGSTDSDAGVDTYGLHYNVAGYDTDAGTTYPSDKSITSEIVSTESALETLQSHAGDISPPTILTLLGYSRYDSSDPLDHEIRATLHEQIHSDVGITLAELTSDTDVSESTVRYHTRILEEESLVDKVDLWGNVRLFPANYGQEQRALTVALDDTALRNVLSAVTRQEPATVSAIAAEIDRAPSTVSHHLSRLETADLLERERDGKRVVTTLKPAVRRALTTGTVEGQTASQIVSD